MKENIKKNKTLQTYYRNNFLRIILLPLILVFFIAILFVTYQAWQEKKQELRITSNSIAENLQAEISTNSVDLGHFIVANDYQMLKSFTSYSEGTTSERQFYSTVINEMYTMRNVQLKPLVFYDFYLADGTTYGFESRHIIGQEEAQKYEWYKKSIDEPDKVSVNIVYKNDLLMEQYQMSNKKVLLFTIAFDSLGKGTPVEMANMAIESDSLEMIEEAALWTESSSIYLLDQDGNIMAASDELYVKEIKEIYNKEEVSNAKIMYSEVVMSRTNWTVVTIVNVQDAILGNSYVIGIIGIGVSIALFLIYIFTTQLIGKIIHPINTLSKAMSSISKTTQLQKCEIDGIYEIDIIGQTYNNMVEEIQQLLVDNQKKEKEKHEEEIKVLELQLSPHFLSNTLSSIRFVAVVAEFESIQKMTESLINILDVSFRTKTSFHRFNEEMKILESYIYLMMIRYSNNFVVTYDIADGCENILVPKLFLQVFIENAITHGFSHSEDIGEIKITILKKQGNLIFNIYDNGIGIADNRIEEILIKEPCNGKTIGVANVNKRLKLYYGEEYSINIKSELGLFTEICFSIPIKE